MKKLVMILPLVLVLCFAFGCQKGEEVVEEPVVDVEADKEAITEWFRVLESTVKSGNVNEWINIFTEDIIKMPPNMPSVKGREAVLQWVMPWFDNYNIEDAHKIEEIEVSGNFAYARTLATMKYMPKAGGETVLGNSKQLFILKRQADGSWKCSRHMINYNEPLPTSGENQ